MAEFKREGDPTKVVDEQWFTYSSSAVVAETYENGGVLFFIVTWDGDRRPFTNIKGLEEEGILASKDEAMKHLEETKKTFQGFADSASPKP